MLQNICFRLAAIAATDRARSCVLLPNVRLAVGRSAETAGLLVRSKQAEELRNEKRSRAKFRASDREISPVLRGFILLCTKHTLVLRGCLQIAPAQRRLLLVERKGFDVFSKQIAVLKDLQFLLACCRQRCLKPNKHPKVDGRVGRP